MTVSKSGLSGLSLRTLAAVATTVLAASASPAVQAGFVAPSWSDYNDDGYDDLAIGVPYESVGTHPGAGAVHVLYGGPNGLSSAGSQRWNADLATPFTDPQDNAHFGWALASGNFDGDAYDDLAIGSPHLDYANAVDTGGYFVLFGSSSGLSATGSRHEAAYSMFSTDTNGWELGYALAAVDALSNDNGAPGSDGTADLAMGIPGAGSDRGFVSLQAWNGEGGHGKGLGPSAGLAGDRCGEALAGGDLDSYAGMDVAIGCPNRNTSAVDSGCVFLIHQGLATEKLICQNAAPAQTPEVNDHFGSRLAVGDLNADGLDDLVVGVPDEDLGAGADAGVVHIFRGHATDGVNLMETVLSQESTGVPGGSAANDRFGAALAIGDFSAFNSFTHADDLAVGVPGDDVGSIDRAGAVVALYWQNGAMLTSGNQRWTQDSTGVLEGSAANDQFGSSLGAGMYSDSGACDLAISVPLEDLAGPVKNAGAVNVLYGSTNKLTADGDQLWHQNSTGIADTAEQADRFGLSLGSRPAR